ncbi:hypothetical protein EV182_006319, partial [Spiromyces aspiralis]
MPVPGLTLLPHFWPALLANHTSPTPRPSLLTAGADSAIHIFDLDAKPPGSGAEAAYTEIAPMVTIPSARSHRYAVTGIEWYVLDTGIFTTCSFDGSVRVWDTNAGETVFSFALGHRVFCHALSPTGGHTLIAGHSGGTLTVAWSPKDEYTLASGG